MSWICASCGEVHEELPALAVQSPDAWFAASPEEREAEFQLTSDICVWRDEHFFLRCSLDLPIIGANDSLNFGIWSSLGKANFEIYLDKWDDPDRAQLAPMFGWLSNQLPDYPDTSGVKCYVHAREPDLRPWLEIEPTDHPLSRHFHEGVTREYAAAYAHKHVGI